MTVTETLEQLKALGNDKVRTQHIKHGAHDNVFGVKMGDIRTIANKIKTDHQLALSLWETGNFEARMLAILIMDGKTLSADEVDGMVRSDRSLQTADWLSNYIIKEHPEKEQLRQQWMLTDHPVATRAGWSLTAGRIARSHDGIDIPAILSRIEKEMPTALPEVQWTMNFALAYIGIHHPTYRERALDIGERLGIFRDYPTSKGCTSPFAPIWINEMVRRQG